MMNGFDEYKLSKVGKSGGGEISKERRIDCGEREKSSAVPQ